MPTAGTATVLSPTVPNPTQFNFSPGTNIISAQANSNSYAIWTHIFTVDNALNATGAGAYGCGPCFTSIVNGTGVTTSLGAQVSGVGTALTVGLAHGDYDDLLNPQTIGGAKTYTGGITTNGGTPLSLADGGTHVIASDTTGVNTAFVLNASNAVAPTNLVALQQGGATKFLVDKLGNTTLAGSLGFTGTSNNVFNSPATGVTTAFLLNNNNGSPATNIAAMQSNGVNRWILDASGNQTNAGALQVSTGSSPAFVAGVYNNAGAAIGSTATPPRWLVGSITFSTTAATLTFSPAWSSATSYFCVFTWTGPGNSYVTVTTKSATAINLSNAIQPSGGADYSCAGI